eukprot:CAMPEP_0168605710 /NCGR_PEP_ID=MMETSP0420-20121227/16142_1 /TAXON_ID=498008 /ORGANISM="Pessonella sp." /LENGTH=666 /DNA_ID=CAMNT_0008645245 /DNA_START=200 /DNA_END=2197 /DNA_ORIENTATION=-
MDFMDLEKEKGITIQSAATRCHWGGYDVNIIDTPGHVDFTIEVERALRVLDGAILVCCSVSGVQSQTITVDRQMKRYDVPRIVFVNKCDRLGANPLRAVQQLKEKLKLPVVAIQLPIGLEAEHKGVICLRTMKALYFDGPRGETVLEKEIPERMLADATNAREEMLWGIADADEELGEILMEQGGENLTLEQINAALRRCTIARTVCPVMMGSAYKNKGVQPLLDAVNEFLPNPTEVQNLAQPAVPIDKTGQTVAKIEKNPKKIPLSHSFDKPVVALAFKLEEGRYGQLTFIRVYQGTLKRGDMIVNSSTGEKFKAPRLVRMHSNEMEDVQEVRAGDICAMFGVDCRSGDTFVADGSDMLAMESMFVPEPVMSLSIKSKSQGNDPQFGKALNRFSKEDPTFRVHTDEESQETIISGMGELHLEIYVERMKREYNVDVVTGKPRVAYRETITKTGKFDYQHKKQTGGAGQYARVIGHLEPLEGEDGAVGPESNDFENKTVGGSVPPQYISACEKGFREATTRGPLIGHPMCNVRMVLTDGDSHSVDSSEMAFSTCTSMATKQGLQNSSPVILEPIMKVEVSAPVEFQGSIIGNLTRRRGLIVGSETVDDYVNITCEVGLSSMFGYSTDLRSSTQGKGEFSMEYCKHAPIPREDQVKMISDYAKEQEG